MAARRLANVLLALGLTVAAALPAAAQSLVPFQMPDSPRETIEIGTSTSEIAITSDFRGADLTVFGALGNPDALLLAIGQYDIIVTLEGPLAPATIRRKERVMGVWINTQSMAFAPVPESYSLASTRALEDIARPQVLADVGAGFHYMALNPTAFGGAAARLGEFRDAFRRLKETHGLYQRDTNGVRFVSSNLFRATLRLPANIPDGVHTVKAYLFKSGTYVTGRTLPLRVVKTGLEQAITEAAHETPYLYGIFCVFLAIATGWGASLIFRKD
ncbi:TIGR02186 family protein [Rhizobiaceae bacterium BDR2-2]|uniref:TIGR02186 family protein n=1 Tax=Ectorhizobium quercum TaxID=2965071 RepID=A0AAE3MVK9_9HYPH|nr:TIGR02186 family protein [Ectorhizobium quercum]MCX8996003.1 TIGR02186 family protein [Ectorhizobium quercum]